MAGWPQWMTKSASRAIVRCCLRSPFSLSLAPRKPCACILSVIFSGAMAKATTPRMSAEEKRIIREMHFDRHMKRAEIAVALGRDKSSVYRLLAQTKDPRPIGRPRALTSAQIDRLVSTLEKMVDDADATYEVTFAMLKKRSRFRVCERVIANALHDRGYWFRDLRHKPILTPDGVDARYAFAKKYAAKPKEWWRTAIHVHLDNHLFKVATTPKGRKLLAKRAVRGVLRKRGKSLRAGHVKPSPKMKLATGSPGILVAGGVGGGKVLVWHKVQGRWNGDSAASFYSNVVAPALKGRYPGKTSFKILEDNDPTGNRSGKGLAAKAASKLSMFEIPKRSPDLNVMDYAVWSEIERRMRGAERKFAASRSETRAQFSQRLDRTAKRLSADFVNKSVCDMRRRCRLLLEAKGGLFEEGAKL